MRPLLTLHFVDYHVGDSTFHNCGEQDEVHVFDVLDDIGVAHFSMHT